ncbi:D-glycero-D-manno-heptose 1-phosphate guanosyltransferase [Candidatus Parvarchaeota archaeon]|nr:D-glycero-D-manno-heptose 1-phosphate guanosyltransferase [Candidatus Parvarchaeota archaeon]
MMEKKKIKTGAGRKAQMPQAVILAGGLGTRLRPLTYSVPKPMVKIEGRPFLGYLLGLVARLGVRDVLLLTGYKHEKIKDYCRDGEKWGLEIRYCREKRQLGTGGAIINASRLIGSCALVLNGDTYLELDLEGFLKFHKKSGALVSVLAKRGSLKDRGAVVAGRGGKVERFLEKQGRGRGLFNTGAYLIEKRALVALKSLAKKGRIEKKFSMESDAFPIICRMGKLYAYKSAGRFIDMGTFRALARAGKVILDKK